LLDSNAQIVGTCYIIARIQFYVISKKFE